MTVKEYLKITQAKKLEFVEAPGKVEKINAINEKWGEYSYPTTLRKWLDAEVIRAYVLSSGVVRINAVIK